MIEEEYEDYEDDLNGLFEKAEDELCEKKYDGSGILDNPDVNNQFNDVRAIALLNKLGVVDSKNIIAGARKDEIYLNVDCDKLIEVASYEDIFELNRCGVSVCDYGLMLVTDNW
jgi:hypothetical protein